MVHHSNYQIRMVPQIYFCWAILFVWVLALDSAADAIAAIIPHAKRQVFEGQSHVASPEVVALILERFFNGRD